MKRKFFDLLFRTATCLCVVFSCAVLLAIIGFIVKQGSSAVSRAFLTGEITGAGASGGIFYNLVGTGILLATTFLVSAPTALSIALLHGVYLRNYRHREKITILLYILNGIPGILFGIVGLVVFVQWFGWGKSWLAGGILLGFMILPTVSVTLIERIASIPRKYIEAAAGLGLRQSEIVRSVILPQSAGGLATGLLLGLARAAGETAPIMFTATIFAGATIPNGIRENPVLSLPYHIFILAQDSYSPEVNSRLWAAALVLVILVFAMSIVALPARLKIHEEADHG
ncbi:MAG: ABC transporter permease subunit [Verrucomicrobiales bacterium]|nr:ABC transporter permease subunit [Verrucomicrobiales bacterium]